MDWLSYFVGVVMGIGLTIPWVFWTWRMYKMVLEREKESLLTYSEVISKYNQAFKHIFDTHDPAAEGDAAGVSIADLNDDDEVH